MMDNITTMGKIMWLEHNGKLEARNTTNPDNHITVSAFETYGEKYSNGLGALLG